MSTVPTLGNGLKLGLNLKHAPPVTFLMSKYVDRSKLPATPKNFGHQGIVKPGEWGILGNDVAGDCFFAGACHQEMVWSREGGSPANFISNDCLDTYSDATGYDKSKTDSKGDNPTDLGTDMVAGCEYWRTKGMPDTSGNRRRIVAYLAIDPTPDDLFLASYLFSGAGLGVDLPSSAEHQFDLGATWTFMRGSVSLGGHYINVWGRQNGLFKLGTWGRVQDSTIYWVERYAQQAVALVTLGNLVGGKSPEGLDSQQLLTDLGRLRSA